MKLFAIFLITAALSGCTMTAKEFLGGGDPCTQAIFAHAGFVTFVASTPKVPAKYVRAEHALYAGIVDHCNSGAFDKTDLRRLVSAYAAIVADYRSK